MRFSIAFLSLLSLTIAAPIAEPESTLDLAKRSLSEIIYAIEVLLPGISGAIADVAGLITQAETTLAALTGTDTSENGLSGSCKALTVLFARGTADPGNVGFLTGPAFFEALESSLGTSKVAVQGVQPYGASVNGFLLGGDAEGSASMAAQITTAFTQCPSTKLILSGYSQGSQVVHNAAALLPAATMAKVSGIVLFGDPKNGQAIPGIDKSKVKTYCHAGDNICLGGDLILLPHLTYAEDAKAAAKVVKGWTGL